MIVDDIQDLRAVSSPVADEIYGIKGHTTVGDNGQGLFYYDSSSAEDDDDGIVVKPNSIDSSDPGRFLRYWDNRTIYLSWFGIPTNSDQTTKLQSILDDYPGKRFYIHDEIYQASTLDVPDNTEIVSNEGGGFFQVSGTNGRFIRPGQNVTLENLVLDGNSAGQTSHSDTVAIVQVLAGKDNVTLRHCTVKNAIRHHVFVKESDSFSLEGCVLDNASNVASVHLRRDCRYWRLIDNKIINTSVDGLKIHGKDSVGSTYGSTDGEARGNVLDYSNVSITGAVVAIELFGGTNGQGCHRSRIEHNTIIAPSSGNFFGVSIDGSDHVTVESNMLRGTVYSPGLENAGSKFCNFTNNFIEGFDGIGISVSQARSEGAFFQGNTIMDGMAGTYGLQITEGTGYKIIGNIFVDAASINIFFNGAGEYSIVADNEFIIKEASSNIMAIEVAGFSHNPAHIRIHHNLRHADQSGSGTGSMKAGEVRAVKEVHFDHNTWDRRNPSGSDPTSGATLNFGGISTNCSNCSVDHDVFLNAPGAEPIRDNSTSGIANHFSFNRFVNIGSPSYQTVDIDVYSPWDVPDVSGSRSDPEAALADLLTELDNKGLITDSTTT